MKKILISILFTCCLQNCYAVDKLKCNGKTVISDTKELTLSTCMTEDENGIFGQNGPYILKNKSEIILVQGQTKKGIPVGDWFNFDENGMLLKKCIYENKDGVPISRCYDKSGKEIIEESKSLDSK